MENSTIDSCNVPRVLKKIGYGVGLLIGVLLVSLLAYYLFALATGTTFNETQWAAAGAWFGGIMTFGAVSVALWQTNLARADTAAAKVEADERLTRELNAADVRLLKELDRAREVASEQMASAEARHTAQLVKSDELLARELDAQRRAEQVRCIPPLWEEILALALPIQEFQELVTTVPSLPRTVATAEKFMLGVKPWMQSLASIEMGFNTPHLIVSEPHTLAALKVLYEDVRRLHQLSDDAITTAIREHVAPDMSELDRCYLKIIGQRNTMTETIREHLTQAPPLKQPESAPS
ncbi:hypothetical protein [Rhodococcus sp. RCBS9]|uniref:hypothetical protein n=1 Tax=Rhodococcus sp. RCBS9 TaxID=3031999 RepID=UPI002402DACF|nr:hypothetical protein [Rhodococcus sp. RCBS9]WEX02772.1 hypothetical protein P0M12_24450 [Rhodococcus sp. RCBS9]